MAPKSVSSVKGILNSSARSKKPVIGTLKKVSYIPSLATNLISVGAAAKLGIVVVFKENICELHRDGETC